MVGGCGRVKSSAISSSSREECRALPAGKYAASLARNLKTASEWKEKEANEEAGIEELAVSKWMTSKKSGEGWPTKSKSSTSCSSRGPGWGAGRPALRRCR